MVNFKIEKIGIEGLPIVKELAFKIWPECYRGIIDEKLIPIMLEKIYSLQELLKDIDERGHIYWLCTIDNKPVGFASAYIESANFGKEKLWIKKLYLLNETRGLGLGKALIKNALLQFPNATVLALFVNSNNAPSIGFYQSQGFEVAAHIPVTMGGFDFTDYVMEKSL